MKLADKVALVTGAARGIGRGCALELAQNGANIAINDREASPESDATLVAIKDFGRRVIFIPANVFERSSCERVVAEVVQEFGQIDILVSNPALQRRASFLEFDAEVFRDVIQGTLVSGFYMSQLAAREMVKHGAGGKIVFISSCHAYIPYAGSVAYNAAKGGLNQMAFTIATELYPHRINVNVVEPGWIDTPGEHQAFGAEHLREAGAALPWGRLGTPEDIGKTVAFLASNDADYITGAAIRVDGGISLKHAHE